MVENYIALIVASMPAFTAFYKTQFMESAFFKSLSSRIKTTWSESRTRLPKWQSKKNSYQDTMSMRLPNDSLEVHTHGWSGSTATLDGQAGKTEKPQPDVVCQGGITRTMELRQTSEHGFPGYNMV